MAVIFWDGIRLVEIAMVLLMAVIAGIVVAAEKLMDRIRKRRGGKM